jgi:hypothetical protein
MPLTTLDFSSHPTYLSDRGKIFLNLTKLDYFNFYLNWCFLSVKLWWLTNSNSPLLIETLADDVLKLTKLQISVRWPVSSD